MNAMDYWAIFMENGAPEAYLSYIHALKTEGKHVPDHTWPGDSGHGLQ